jgi:hypothetical protein
MEHNHSNQQLGMWATSTLTSIWLFLQELVNRGPSWNVVPPLVIACTGFLGALTNFLNERQRRKIEADKYERSLVIAPKATLALEGLEKRT